MEARFLLTKIREIVRKNFMDKKIIYTEQAPKPVGPYSQAIQAGPFLFVSGQIPIDPKTGAVVRETFAQECRQVLENVKAVLTAGGSSLPQVVKVTIFLKDLNKFKELNSIYQEYFGESNPARATIEVARLPLDVSVEIEVIALCNS